MLHVRTSVVHVLLSNLFKVPVQDKLHEELQQVYSNRAFKLKIKSIMFTYVKKKQYWIYLLVAVLDLLGCHNTGLNDLFIYFPIQLPL